jgi:hypothetical protein
MKLAAIAFSALLSLLPLMANADTYETFAISGTDSQRQQDLGLGVSGCDRPICTTYAPGTFSGSAIIDISTDSIVAATISTDTTSPAYGGLFLVSAATTGFTQNIGSGLDLILPTDNSVSQPASVQPTIYLDLNLSSDSVSGYISGPQVGPGVDQTGASYALDMVGKLTPVTAPEINVASAASMVTLLFGGLVVMRGRKHKYATA